MPIQPSSTRYLKPSAVLRAEPRGKPFSAWSNELHRTIEQALLERFIEGHPVDLVVPAVRTVKRRTKPADLDRVGSPRPTVSTVCHCGTPCIGCRHALPHEIVRNEYNVQSFSTRRVGTVNRLRKGVPLSELFIQRPTSRGGAALSHDVSTAACALRPSRGHAVS